MATAYEPDQSSQSGSRPTGEAGQIRLTIFLYELFILGFLLTLAIFYFRTDKIGHILPSELRGLPAYTAWFGVLGSVSISLKGVYDHGPTPQLWGGRWPLWYFGRPFSGLIVGIIVYVFLRALYPTATAQPSLPTFEAAAFILGAQEQRFFLFLGEVGKLILAVPTSTKGGD